MGGIERSAQRELGRNEGDHGEPSNGAGAGPAAQKRRGVGRKADNA